jgi:outer membrane protein OmpA-like peptidoglycan-associated protein
MVLRVHGASDSWSEVELVPWSVDIPHEDVVFASGSADIPPGETHKLDAAYDRILAAIREHGSDMSARLYVLGHTDTVGSAADNAALSQRRATSIARHFRTRGGITLPIVARGFGETMLAVRTPDSTDEPRNRRAQYILAAQPPVAGAWHAVP